MAFNMRRPPRAQDVCYYRGQLDVRFLQHRLDALRVLHDLSPAGHSGRHCLTDFN